jgi:hypothetical protein
MTACVRTGNIVPNGGNTAGGFFVFSVDTACFSELDPSFTFEVVGRTATRFGASSTKML